MLGYVLGAVIFGGLYATARMWADPTRDRGLAEMLVVGFILRLCISLFVRDVQFFNSGLGGDSEQYERFAVTIAQYWDTAEFTFVTDDVLPELGLGPTSLPSNVYALVIWLNGGATLFGCSAIVALLACATCWNLYALALELGAAPKPALRMVGVLLFSPAFVLYTSDMFKDGFVVFLVTTTVASAFRLSRRFSILHTAIGLMSILALWFVRHYLIFVAVAPLAISLLGLRAKTPIRPIFASLILVTGLLVVAAYTDAFVSVSHYAAETFDRGTNEVVRGQNAGGGSGVVFDDGGNPWGSLGPKLLYTILSPFPWETGSLGLQIGKLDVAIWYYVLYRAWVATRRLRKTELRTIVMFLTFIVPTTVMYATGFANIGLNLRQRLPIVFVTALLSMLSWPAAETASEESKPKSEPLKKLRSPNRLSVDSARA